MRWLVLLFLPLFAWAHPVIYKDGIMLSSMTMHDFTELGAFYSYTPKWAVGAEYLRLESPKGEEKQLELARLNHLAYRYNGPGSQGNIYLVSGLGRAHDDVNDNRLGWLGGVEADWESREYFISSKYTQIGSPDFDAGIWVSRIGYSPIIADFDSLQSWVMLQTWYDPITSKETKITPMLRFFYKNVLWEMGASLKGDAFFNWMIHI
ncbi:MAG: hypothetical protein K2P81_09160 [Bacteriovoracaceae bacterium]|nr:hypothetical protein [Bacteriovoracaceae bacterium]